MAVARRVADAAVELAAQVRRRRRRLLRRVAALQRYRRQTIETPAVEKPNPAENLTKPNPTNLTNLTNPT